MIGDPRTLGIDLMPVQPSWDVRYGPEAAGWAGLAVWVDGQNLCAHTDTGRESSGSIRSHVFVPLGPVCDWLITAFPGIAYEERHRLFPTTGMLHRDSDRWADSPPPSGVDVDEWLDGREAWWSRHFVRAGADGALLPDLALCRDDEHLVIDWTQRPHALSDIRFIHGEGRARLPWEAASDTIRSFVLHVSDFFSQAGQKPYAWIGSDEPLEALSYSRDGALELFVSHSLERLMALLRVDSRAELEATLGLSSDWVDPGGSVACQVLRDLSPAMSGDVARAALELNRDTGNFLKATIELAGWKALRATAHEAVRPAASVEESGQFAAAEIRRVLGINGDPIPDVSAVAAQAGMSVTTAPIEGGFDAMIVGAPPDSPPRALILDTVRTRTPWGQRFETGRALGHALCDPIRAGALGAGSSTFSRSLRRRRAGAFAAELLLPARALADRSEDALDGIVDGDRFQSIMSDFGVGARTAAYQLWNRGWLSGESVRDELIDRHARAERG